MTAITLQALDDWYRMETERIERGPFIWVGNSNFIEAVRERLAEDPESEK